MKKWKAVMILTLVGIFIQYVAAKHIKFPSSGKKAITSENLKKETSKHIIDARDGQKYTYIQIGRLLWLKQNLNYNSPDSECYQEKEENCEKYGRLYPFEDSRMACPSGWHLPSPKEWKSLKKKVGSKKADKIIAKDEWQGEDFRGATNELGLDILPGGRKDEKGADWRGEEFGEKGISSSYWLDDPKYHWHIRWGKSHIHQHGDISQQGRKFYIRCVCEVEKFPAN
ncbi:MAG: FISUMP domain-containing protein [Bacteroidota bacterium]